MTNLKDLLRDDDGFYDDDYEYRKTPISFVDSNSMDLDADVYVEESYDDRTMDWGYLADLDEEGWWTNPD
ncbi:hypothetical protein IQ225_17285, partial [Synechocystis salina LEGE 06155]|nr:hypothetical protein [Synechocystis salina LEGE 06155]